MRPILSIECLGKIHPGQVHKRLFSNISAHIEQPETIALLGTSGAGKSTLLRILGLLEAPDEGDLFLHGKTVGEWTPREWRTKVCYVAQHSVMLPESVEDNLRVVSLLHNRPFDRGEAASLMETVGLGEMDWDKRAADLSGGEKQRLALVRSLLLDSEVLLVDEATASLDAHSRDRVERLITETHRSKAVTVVWVTHDLQQAQRVSRRVWFLSEGKLEDKLSEHFFEEGIR